MPLLIILSSSNQNAKTRNTVCNQLDSSVFVQFYSFTVYAVSVTFQFISNPQLLRSIFNIR